MARYYNPYLISMMMIVIIHRFARIEGNNRDKREDMIEGKFESRIESIRELMRNLNLSPEKAIKVFGLSPSEFSRYLTLL